MTEPIESNAASIAPPLPIRIAATLCAVVGVVSAIGVISVEREIANQANAPVLPLLTNPLAVVAIWAAAVLIWKRRKLGGYLLLRPRSSRIY